MTRFSPAWASKEAVPSGLETGDREKASYVLEQGRIRMMFSTPLNGNNELAEHIRKHGDGVKDIAFHVDDAKGCYEACIARGAKSAHKPEKISDENGTITKASIFTYGETVHSFISYDDYKGPFLPGFIEQKSVLQFGHETQFQHPFQVLLHNSVSNIILQLFHGHSI